MVSSPGEIRPICVYDLSRCPFTSNDQDSTTGEISRARSLAAANSCGNRGRGTLSLSHEKSQTMRHQALSARSLFRGERYSICELPDGEIKGAGSFVRWQNRKARSPPPVAKGEKKDRKKKIRRKEKMFPRDLNDVFGAAYRPRLRW